MIIRLHQNIISVCFMSSVDLNLVIIAFNKEYFPPQTDIPPFVRDDTRSTHMVRGIAQE